MQTGLKTMEASSLSYHTLCLFFFLFLFPRPSNSQQEYLNDTGLNCSSNVAISKGYLCDGQFMKSCKSFVNFRSRLPYDTAISIAYLLGSEASQIASLNNISSTDNIPTNISIVVPISCMCSGNIYEHFTPYTVKKSDTYYITAKETYQGLTTCQSMISRNYYNPKDIPVGSELMVPVRCACPSQNQSINGVNSLLTYVVDEDETVVSIGNKFGASTQSILEANMLSQQNNISDATPILVPLKSESCSEYPRMFFCNCPNGQLTYGSSDCVSDHGKSFPVKLVTLLGIGIGFGLLCLLLSGYKLYQCLKRRRIKTCKERFFKQNGGSLLQEKKTFIGNGEKARLFTAEELERATDNYNQSRFLGKGGYGTVYKGMLRDGIIVAIKKSKEIDRKQVEQFVNEVLILSQINHRNIVKLLGCCLETETPLLVYEFISNGTLFHHIRKKEPESSLSWENRLNIACDVAGALAYMHASASMPIFHRDIKSSNILLDDKFNAKVSDFGTSRSVPEDKTHLTTAVQGTFGYMDPEYFQSSRFTDKSDVYSYGVTLVELLTGENPFHFAKDDGKNLVASFISLTGDNQVVQILDPRVIAEARMEDIQAIAELGTRCLRLNGKKRPTMKEVSVDLEGLRKSQRKVEDIQSSASELSCVNNTSNTIQEEPAEQSIEISLEMGSMSV
ncbi:LysM receptor kinase [Parasponia andersonii]|uniref:LysM receptor kinase n=1 Tax=Parasponia andersonii TaxID=3476 RepID=A0A2P5B9L6_PARAD|nr:LysM receptor kinase [Parasponia andersonii]